ncbi:permease-like cell division protein FtsX [Alteribacter natronophilus]|uniref:permease-like cell division protein FtsX n=1 Tax=Alteribacter natronophilus TaxID=2583810 RepID=UPI00110D5E83|nr:permease-like cell division protein FtsX [Alteribacter natronophilus]TMW72398.1 ABC transporter permease [Alteribacter natronophilus]
MKGRTFVRHLKEGAKNIGRNGWMTFASVSAVTIMLFVVGAFLLLIMNMNAFADSLEDDVELRVFIELTADEEQQDELETEIAGLSQVDTVEFVPREEGLENLIVSFGDQGQVLEALREENPLNDVFVVQAEDPQQTQVLADEIQTLENVDDVEYGADIVDQLFSVTNILRYAGIAVIAGLMFTAMFLIANTIKITIIARKREIQIMKLVGATNGFIRWPFFVEGLLLGLLGAVIPVSALSYGYVRLVDLVEGTPELGFLTMLPANPLTLQMAALLLGIGAFIGIWGSMMSVRKFLKV